MSWLDRRAMCRRKFAHFTRRGANDRWSDRLSAGTSLRAFARPVGRFRHPDPRAPTADHGGGAFYPADHRPLGTAYANTAGHPNSTPFDRSSRTPRLTYAGGVAGTEGRLPAWTV